MRRCARGYHSTPALRSCDRRTSSRGSALCFELRQSSRAHPSGWHGYFHERILHARDMNRVVVVRSALPEGSIEAPARALGTAFTLGAVLRFETVYRDHAGFVWRVLRGMGVADVLVEDAVQDAFVVVHRRLPEFDGRHSV